MPSQTRQPDAFPDKPDSTGNSFLTSSSSSAPLRNLNGHNVTHDDHIAGLTRFFGIPQKEVRQNPYAQLPKEILVLPEAWHGPNPFLTTITIRKITSTDVFALRRMLPWKHFEGSGEYQWTEIQFNNHMLGRVPELGAPRLVTQTKTSRSVSTVRFGLGLEAEHGFYLTPEGQRQWAMHLTQIANAAIETGAYGAVMAALEFPPYQDNHDKFRDATARSMIDLEGIFRNELSGWAAIQKPDAGLSMVVGRAERAISHRGSAKADVWLFPEGTKEHAQGSQLESLFYLSGRRSGEERDVMKDVGASENNIGFSRGFISNDQEPAHDPSFRDQTIGTFFQLDNAGISSVPPAEFRTSMMNRIVYNENRDSFQQFGYQDNFKYTGLVEDWDDDKKGLKLSHIGQEFFGRYESCLDFIRAADDNEYCVESLLSKSKEDHQDFLTNVVNRTLLELGLEAAAVPVQGAVLSHMGGRHRQSAHTGAAFKGTDATVWSLEAKQQAKSFMQFLRQLPDRGIPLVEAYSDFVKNNAQKQLTSVYNASWAHVARWLLEYDQLGSFARLKTTSRFERTEFEKAYDGVRQRAMSSGGDQQVLDQLKRSLSQADSQSPSWAPVAGKHPFIQLRATPFASSQQYISLAYKSLSFTLPSTHLVLFKVDNEALKALLAAGGSIQFNESSVSGGDPVLNEVERFGLLQFSVTLSAVFTLIENFLTQAAKENQVSDASRRQLSVQIASLVPASEPHSGQHSVMEKVANEAVKMPVLTTQKFAEAQIRAVAKLLMHIYDVMPTGIVRAGTVLSRALDMYLQVTIDSMQDQIETFDVTQQQQTGAALHADAARDAARDEHILRKKVVDKTALVQLKQTAEKTVDQLHDQIVKNPADRELYTDSFNSFYENYVYIYQLLYVNADLYKPLDMNKVFEAIVKNSHKFWSMKKESPFLLTRQYLKLIILVLQDRDQQMITDLDLLSETETSTSRETALKKGLKNIIAGLSTHTAIEINTVLGQLRSNLTTASRKSDFETQREIPVGVTSFNELVEEAFTRFENVNMSFAMAVLWAAQLDQNQSQVSQDLIDKYHPSNNTRAIAGYLDAVLGIDLSRDADETGYNTAKVIMGEKAHSASTPAAGGILQKLTRQQLERVLKKLPITGKFLKWCIQRNVYIPIQLLCFRPMMRYSMGSAVHMAGGGETGWTLIGYADFMLADNAVQKKHYGDYTQYQTSVVFNPRNLIVMHNVLCRDYLGGNGTQCWDPLDDEHLDAYSKNALIADVFVVPELGNWKNPGSVLDLTGQFHPDLRVDRQANDFTRYTVSTLLTEIWGWSNRKSPAGMTYHSKYHQARFNTLCFEAYSRYYNHSNKLLSTVVSEKGHWANCVYEGCGAVRRGNSHQFKPPVEEFARLTM